jgi:hypothetical protein
MRSISFIYCLFVIACANEVDYDCGTFGRILILKPMLNRIRNVIRHMVFQQLVLENGALNETLYTERTNCRFKKDHKTRTLCGHVSWIRALVLLWWKVDATNWYKIKSKTETDTWCLNGWLTKHNTFLNTYSKSKSPF